MNRRPPISEQDIVDRAEQRRRGPFGWKISTLAVIFVLVLGALYDPIHAWLHRHLELIFGILIGSSLEMVGWIRDRWRWMKWFSL